MSIGREMSGSMAELAGLLTDARGLSADWTPAQAQSLHSALQQCADSADLRVGFAGNYTLDPLPSYTATACARHGVALATHNLGFDQYFLDVLKEDGELARFSPDVSILLLSLRRLAPRVYHSFASLSDGELASERDAIMEHMEQWLDAAAKRHCGVPIIGGFPPTAALDLGIADSSVEHSQSDFIQELNAKVKELLRDRDAGIFLDVARVVSRVGIDQAFDERLYYLAKIAFSDKAVRALADTLSRVLFAIAGRTKKCLVVDLDNTLWAGIVGEDGPLGIRVGPGDPVGEAHAELQHAVRALQDRGVVLAICSKNNESDVREAFSANPDMPLRLEDFAAQRVNWEPKPDNLREIAAELNIGLDSLVFVDDSERECELVRNMLPEVEVVHLGGDPAHFATAVRNLVAFERVRLTDEDRQKTKQYQQNSVRNDLRQRVDTVEQFLEELQTRATIRPAEAEEMARVEQLFNKTNQFNLTTVRHRLAEIERIAADPGWLLRIVQARDRFGDLGIIGLFLLRRDGETLAVNSLLLSCRVIGRGLETAMVNAINQEARTQGVKRLVAEYRPTARNGQVKNLFELQGFEFLEEDRSGIRRYGLDVATATLLPCAHIDITSQGARP